MWCDLRLISKYFKFHQAFTYLPVKGNVRLKDPDVVLQYIEYYGTDPKSPPENPYLVLFGRWVRNVSRGIAILLLLFTF